VATVSVVVLVALTIYIVAGLLALARVPDAGSPIRRLVQLALWPLALLRNAASPSRRQGRHAQVQVAPAIATATAGAGLAAPAVHASPATATAATAHPMLAAAAPTALEDPAPAVESGPQAPADAPAEPDAADLAAAPASAAPAPPSQDAVPEPPPRDLRADWERFVLRLTEPSD